MAVGTWTLATDAIAYDLHVKRYVATFSTDGGAYGTLPYMTGEDSTPWLPLPQASVVRWSFLSNTDWGLSYRNPATPVSPLLTGLVQTGSTATNVISQSALSPGAWFGGNYWLKITSGALSGQVARIVSHTALSATTNSFTLEAPGFTAAPALNVTYAVVRSDTIGNRPNFYVYTSNADVLAPKESGHIVANPTAVYNPLAAPALLQFAWSATGEILVPNSYIAFALDGVPFDGELLTGILGTLSVTVQNRGSI